MAIKVTIGESKTQEEKPFPKLMKGLKSGQIVFFYKHSCGTQLTSSDEYYVGWYSEEWIMKNFTDYNEPITLQNQ